MRNKLVENKKFKTEISPLADQKAKPESVKNTSELLKQGLELHKLGQIDKAKAFYEQILKFEPNHFDAIQLLGAIATQTKQWQVALELFSKASQINPFNVNVFCNKGIVLKELGFLDQALVSLSSAINLNVNHAESYMNRGLVFKRLNRLDDALKDLTRAIELRCDYAEAYSNYASALESIDKLDDAFVSYNKAIEINPKLYEAYCNRGNLLRIKRRFIEAQNDYDSAINLNTSTGNAYAYKSTLLLLTGDLSAGFELYEWRFKAEFGFNRLRALLPDHSKWQGRESLVNKRILIYSEQGLGDTLQFCRYLKLVSNLGAHVIFMVQGPLINLLNNLDGVDEIRHENTGLPEFDFHCPLMSLPLAFKTTLDSIPNQIPYIKADIGKAAYWQKKLSNSTKLKVGLVWSGGFKIQAELWTMNNRRNLPLEHLNVFKDLNIDFFSLQKGEPAESEFKALKQGGKIELNINDYGDELKDFTDTAALIHNLDLVISVDTSTAHLAAAMGKPVWILSRYDGCWRWMLNKPDSPWYPSVKLYAQSIMGDWQSVCEKIRVDLLSY